MSEVLPSEICPETGICSPSNNPYFYPEEHMNLVINQNLKESE